MNRDFKHGYQQRKKKKLKDIFLYQLPTKYVFQKHYSRGRFLPYKHHSSIHLILEQFIVTFFGGGFHNLILSLSCFLYKNKIRNKIKNKKSSMSYINCLPLLIGRAGNTIGQPLKFYPKLGSKRLSFSKQRR